MLARGLMSNNRAAFAQTHLARAAAAGGMTPALALQIAATLRAQAKIPDAVEAFQIAVEMSPNDPHARAGLIGALEAGGRLHEAAIAIDYATKLCPMRGDLRRVTALVFAAQGDHAGAVALLQGDDLAPIEFLDRGRYREKLGDYAGAWSDWMHAKAFLCEKAGHVYKADHMARLAADLIDVSQASWQRFIVPADLNEAFPQPIFVTGFPRSGTTMTEAILAAHSRVVAGDELMGVSEVMRMLPRWLRARVPYPAVLMATSHGENEGMPDLLRDYYLRKAQTRIGFALKGRGRPKFFTDKMPLNEMHLPLIWCLFPASPVLHVRRHPLDVIVSNMSHFLTHGGFFASSLESAAHHLVLVDDVLQHHKRNLVDGAGRDSVERFGRAFREVNYEKLVAAPADEIDALIGWLGLTPEPACREFHKSDFHSRTISYRQIKEPVNGASIGRWRNFREYLAPIIETVRPICEREGYEL